MVFYENSNYIILQQVMGPCKCEEMDFKSIYSNIILIFVANWKYLSIIKKETEGNNNNYEIFFVNGN